ncbi:MAG: exosortase system-associated protein, TIGR04073 family [Candidatus Omnitrophota bacterium]|nr:exosortase system-associated protein, TIGR04073 family [Candidatus Omnitrophota bacterium]
MRRWMAVFLLVIATVAAAAAPASAVGNEIDTLGGMGAKLSRGTLNLVTGWLEIPKQISNVWQESGPGPGMTMGFIKGLGFAVGRTAVGAYEIVTFPAPLPDGYQPIVQPKFVFSDWQIGSHESSSQ